jgi:hypothetical protein
VCNNISPWRYVLKKINKREENDDEKVKVCLLSINRQTTSTQRQVKKVSKQVQQNMFLNFLLKVTSYTFCLFTYKTLIKMYSFIHVTIFIIFFCLHQFLYSIMYSKSNLTIFYPKKKEGSQSPDVMNKKDKERKKWWAGDYIVWVFS